MGVRWSPSAKSSLAEILAYIDAYFGRTISRRVGREITNYTRTLARNPYLGRTFMRRPYGYDVRVLLYKGNRIYYQVFDNHIDVIVVWDGRRDPNKLQDTLNSYLNLNSK